MNKDLLSNISKKLVAPKKGVLAADESNPTIKKRFDSIGIESNENYRRNYRDLLFSTQNLEEYISGVILYEETLYQKNSKGQSLTKILSTTPVVMKLIEKNKLDLDFPLKDFYSEYDTDDKKNITISTAGETGAIGVDDIDNQIWTNFDEERYYVHF